MVLLVIEEVLVVLVVCSEVLVLSGDVLWVHYRALVLIWKARCL